MDRRDLLGGLFWLGISIFVCVVSIRDEFGTFHSPGPGFFPFLSAIVLGAFAIILMITSSLKKRWERKMADLWKGLEWKKVAWVLFSLFLYPLVLPFLGYLLATFGLMAFLLGVMGRTKVWVRGVNALIVTLASYVIFYKLLDVRLPKGMLGF
jgi:putative tricarboxylic transport membrane protein